MISKGILTWAYRIYDWIGSEFSYPRAKALKSKADQEFKCWSERCNENPDLPVKYLKSYFVICFIVCFLITSILSKLIGASSNWMQPFWNELIGLMFLIILPLKTKSEFIQDSVEFFPKMLDKLGVFVFLITIYVGVRLGFDLNTLNRNFLIDKYVSEGMVVLGIWIILLFISCNLMPFLIYKFIQFLLTGIIKRANSRPEGTPIKHFLKYCGYVFSILSFINLVGTCAFYLDLSEIWESARLFFTK